MNILLISGSSRPESTNIKLLNHLPRFSNVQYHLSDLPKSLPLFRAECDASPLAEIIIEWRRIVAESDAMIICTPEYIHNLPALIKNALEWLTSSGEMVGKKVLAITLTPNPPRGEKAMQSLLWSLKALDARVVASLPLHISEVKYSDHGAIEGETRDILEEAIQLLL